MMRHEKARADIRKGKIQDMKNNEAENKKEREWKE